MANKKDLFGGFDALSLSSLLVNSEDGDIVNLTEDEDDAKESTNITPDVSIPAKGIKPAAKEEKTEKVDEEDETEEDTEKLEPEKSDDDTKEEEIDYLEHESEISVLFADELADKLGIDIPEDYKVEKLDDVVSLLVDIVKENSKPQFANDEVEKYNKFVEQGGDLKKFYEETYGSSIDVDKLDVTSESDQKAILRQHMTNQGYKEERIKRAIDRYDEAGVLKDEAEEALELVKEFNEKKAKKLLAEQEKFQLEQENAKQIFVDTVYDTVKGAKDIRGINISDSEKRELLDYMFKADTKGMTALQRDYQDPKKRINNIIESAYFMKYGDKIINKNKEQGATDAYKAIREKLKAGKGKRSAGSNTNFDKASKPLRDLSSLLISS